MAVSLMFVLFCVALADCAVSAPEATRTSKGPLPRAYGSPINVDSEVDCAIKVLAWEYAKKLLPRHGNNQAVYDALQLSSCNVSLNSGKKYASFPLRYNALPGDNRLEVFVDPKNGNDDNPGSSSQPVKTISRAVLLMRLMRASVEDKRGIIYLSPGHYTPAKTINLTAEDSNLAFVGSGTENTFIHGAKQYSFEWQPYIYKNTSMVENVSIVSDTLGEPGKDSGWARFVSKEANASQCRSACDEDPSCFAYTWFDDSHGNFAHMCYFRTDGIWASTAVSGAVSGKKLNISVADLSNQNPVPFSILFLSGRRAVRARYPDGNPETMGLHTNYSGYTSSAVKWLPPVQKPPAEEVHIQSPAYTRAYFTTFNTGIGGPADVFVPPKSYWCTANPLGGGGMGTYAVPSGVVYSSDEEFVTRSWSNPKTGVMHVINGGHWGNWQFKIDDRDERTNTITWSYGGFQEARGHKVGAEWYVDNIFEELDAPGEWFYDEVEKKLYLYPNGTGFSDNALPASGYGTMLQRVLNIRGTLDNPVYNITIVNMTFTQTEPTYLEGYEAPSGGDWSIHRGGAVYVEGVNGFTMQTCLFDSPGGNGLFLSNYIRNAVVEANEFRFVGDSAIAALGSTEMIDGTNGNQPRGVKIVNNLMYENGVFGKQSAAYFQSLACQTEFEGNVLFNGPRDGINFNDNFGGGNILNNNLAFNMVRESQDCGPFNFFDRLPYITRLYDGHSLSIMPAMSYISRNFIIANYHSLWPLDHDDGSCYYEDTSNFLVYGGYKNNLGHSKAFYNNTYIYPDAVHQNVRSLFITYPYCGTDIFSTLGVSGWGEVWAFNKCVIGNPNVYYFDKCNVGQDNRDLVPFTYNNEFYAPNKYIYINCGSKKLTLEEYQKLGFDKGSVVHDLADISTIISWATDMFDL